MMKKDQNENKNEEVNKKKSNMKNKKVCFQLIF